MKNLIIMLLVLSPAAIHAQVYKCDQQGKVSYQAAPCTNDSKQVNVAVESSKPSACFVSYLQTGANSALEYRFALAQQGNGYMLKLFPPQDLDEKPESHLLRTATKSEIGTNPIKIDEAYSYVTTKFPHTPNALALVRSDTQYRLRMGQRLFRLLKTSCERIDSPLPQAKAPTCFSAYLSPKGERAYYSYIVRLSERSGKYSLQVIPPAEVIDPEDTLEMRAATREELSAASTEAGSKIAEGYIFLPIQQMSRTAMAGIYSNGSKYIGHFKGEARELTKISCAR